MPNDCRSCKHYWHTPTMLDEQCRHGVVFGTHPVPSTSVRTMRSDSWWGTAACGEEGRFWEPKQ